MRGTKRGRERAKEREREMASVDENGRKYTATKKAYKNEAFINSSQASPHAL